MGRFGVYYLKNKSFRETTDGVSFLFVDGDYEGVYPNFEAAGKKSRNKIFPKCGF